ncbi:MAG: hypothetical protein ACKO38_20110 [Planctomycetota bacterium]
MASETTFQRIPPRDLSSSPRNVRLYDLRRRGSRSRDMQIDTRRPSPVWSLRRSLFLPRPTVRLLIVVLALLALNVVFSALSAHPFLSALISAPSAVAAEVPRPVLRSVFPAGGQAGTSFVVDIDGLALDGPPFDLPPSTASNAAAPRLWFADSRIQAVARGPKSFEVTIPAEVLCHRLDVRVVGRNGISGPRVFQITPAAERLEQEPNDTPPQATPAPTPLEASSTAILFNGRLEKPADVDCFRVACRAGQKIVFELWADRLDSPLRGTLEIIDATGRRLIADRGRLGAVDPRIDFAVPADGEYTVRVFDQTYLGGADFIYRLAVDAGPRVDFATPAMLSTTASRLPLTLWGRNLGSSPAGVKHGAPRLGSASLENQVGELDVARQGIDWTPLRPSREAFVDMISARWSTSLQPFPLAFSSAMPLNASPNNASPNNAVLNNAVLNHLPPDNTTLANTPLLVEDGVGNHGSATAKTVTVPADLAGRLEAADEQDWYVFEARGGEVFWLEGYAERLGAPVDLELFVFDAEGRELLHLADQSRNPLGTRFPTDTTDPAGRFTAPRDGSYYLVASNAIAAGSADDRRRYAISLRREEADFRLVVTPRAADAGAGLRAPRGGRDSLEVLVHRRNGFAGPLRVGAVNLPVGWNCEESWIAADEDRGLLVVTAPASGPPEIASPNWLGVANVAGQEIRRAAMTGAATRIGDPRGVARTTHGAPIAGVGEAPLFVEAALETALDSHRASVVSVNAPDPLGAAVNLPFLFQDSVVEVRVDVRRAAGAEGPIELQAIGLPRGVRADFATIPPGEVRGWISLWVARDQVVGPFSFAIQASLLPPEPASATTAAPPRRSAKPPVSTTVSNLLSAQIAPGRIHMAIDPRTPRKIARGEVIHVKYSAERRHGFIGKIHTELAAPGGVRGIRGRGVTFTSQTETGEIQIIATENAPLGPIHGLRLEAIGTVEDQPTYLGGCLLDLEIIE